MRSGLIIVALLALVLQGCGGGQNSKDGAAAPRPAQPQQVGAPADGAVGAAPQAAGSNAAPASGAKTAAPKLAPTFVPSAKGRRAPAVLLVTDDAALAKTEAERLRSLGIASLAVRATSSVRALSAAFKTLKARSDVDARRLGVVALGAPSIAAARLLARDPSVGVAVLGDVGAEAAKSLVRVRGAKVLLQRGTDAPALSEAQMQRLMAAAPLGTLLNQYKQLGAGAQADRDRWLKSALG